MIQIDRNIPMPTITRSGRAVVYPCADMKVGDSFYIKTVPRGSLSWWSKKLGHEYISRKNGKGYRVWRVK